MEDRLPNEVTFIIPIGPLHTQVAQRAIDSVNMQTIEVSLLSEVDTTGEGPGALRNKLLRKVNTEFVVFLDADDWIEPSFAEDTIAEYRRVGGGVYVFTDWSDDEGQTISAPCRNGDNGLVVSARGAKPYCGGTWHAITTLLPTAWVRQVGGFDETLPAVEDTDFYLKLCTTKKCGHHLAKPLFHYSANGGRAAAFYHGNDRQRVMGELSIRYGGKMGCCGDTNEIRPPIGQRQPGDVLAQALWAGNRTEHGRATGRIYPRISYPRTTWVDPKDAAISGHLWQVVDQPVDAPQPMTVEQMAMVQMSAVKRTASPVAATTAPSLPLSAPQAAPDVSRVLKLGRSAVSTDPVFVFSETFYPSYSDIRRLVELSGFRTTTTKQIDAFSRAPHIVVSPEPIPDLNGLKVRVICWQLEYAGDYTKNYAGFNGELWASDKAWADQNKAKYVLMGSHPGLVGEHPGEADFLYDVTMLGYMVPRRQAIKDALSDLRWPVDYPGHDTEARNAILWDTRLMVQVHQHDNAPFIAPQRVAIAAAYHMPMLSETVADAGDLTDYILFSDYHDIPDRIVSSLKYADGDNAHERLHQYLCFEQSFRSCVEEALK